MFDDCQYIGKGDSHKQVNTKDKKHKKGRSPVTRVNEFAGGVYNQFQKNGKYSHDNCKEYFKLNKGNQEMVLLLKCRIMPIGWGNSEYLKALIAVKENERQLEKTATIGQIDNATAEQKHIVKTAKLEKIDNPLEKFLIDE